MDRIDELLKAANPVRPSNAPRLDAHSELRAALDGAPGLDAAGQDYVVAPARIRQGKSSRRLWTAAIAVVVASLLVIAAVVLTQVMATLAPAPPAGTPSPTTSGAAIGSDQWRVVRMPTTEEGGTAGPQIEIDVAPGFVVSSDVPNESYDSLSTKILPDGPGEDVLAQIYYGKVLPQRDPQACVAVAEQYVELDSVPVDVPANSGASGTGTPRFVYRVVQGTTLKASFGLTALAPGTASDSCTEFHHINSTPEGTTLAVSDHYQFNGLAPGWLSTATTSLTPTFASLEEARAFMATEQYRTYKRMFTSVRIVQP